MSLWKKEQMTMPTNNHRTVLRQLANLVKHMRPLVEQVVSDEFSPAERRKLRELAGRP